MLPLGVVVDRLRGLVGPGQLGRVALSARLAEMADWQMPAVCVMPGDDRAASAGEYAPQLIDVEMLVVVAVRNLADGRGEGALAALQPARLLIYSNLVGWVPEPGDFGAGVHAAGAVRWVGGRVLAVDNAVIIWADSYVVPISITLPASPGEQPEWGQL